MRLRACSFVALALTLLTAPAAARQSSGGLNILLTNDDGFEAPGIEAMREALIAAGHRVTVVAPLEDRSGSGTSHTTEGLIDYYRQEEGVWAVDGTPTDAVTLALVHIMRADPPDLVVSGSNFGQSVGADVNSSGTVAAALTATRAGVPAIAVSVANDLREAERATPFASTIAALRPAADLVVEVIRQLDETGGDGLLPPRTVLNVNYPAVGSEPPEGVRFAAVSSVRAFRRGFSVAGDTGPAKIEVAAGDPARGEEGSDLALLEAGYATISVIDGSWDAGRASWEPLLKRLIIER